MLHINGLTYRIGGRLLLEDASVAVPEGHKVGIVGRNGVGKSTLFKLILGELPLESGSITLPRNARIGTVAQEAPGGPESLLATVMAGDAELTALNVEAETATDPHRIAEIQTRLADMDAHSAEARAATILSGLGFSDETQQGPCSALSGGWRMRVALAAALFARPDVLLLDEPTNYLDLEGTIWLKSFIRDYPHTIVLISHDRDLLNEAVGYILHLERGKLTLYQGNYDSFERQRREKQALTVKLKKKQEDQRKHMMAFVERFRYKASKARQAQSRLKALSKLEPIAELVEDRVAPFFFPNPEKAIAPPLVKWDKVSVGYAENRPVLRNITLRLDPDDRIALLGSNGNGKSTFAKLLCGKLSAMAGDMKVPARLTVGYFAQHQLDEISPERTPYSYFTELMPDEPESKRRAKLGAYGFGANLADSPCSTLSGGEKARLLFALAAFHAPHILVLDEPTNHLDVDSREALIMAINDYEGAVILISHDRHIIETCADDLWLVHDGTVKRFDGDMEDYTQLVLDRARASRRAERAAKEPAAEAPRQPARPSASTLQKQVEKLDKRMEEIRGKIEILDKALSDPAIYSEEPKKAGDFTKLRAKLATDLEELENQWLEAQVG
ncbi:ABC transporter ATP-binding protein [Aestuariivirga litoralis]|uniref:ABC transporter ATP-binding protein n=1 Tax=Aestuariivirga litoralis TaxID=2650924 RepID=A0A2W2AQE6_9HYPH|nr:ABC-F family ATP-binding cassette domain-containing protein [Aestuariivirga litoralis]PZF77621.1 ABC transporter ATP-binding protein [Aestuariivirga litoralis]